MHHTAKQYTLVLKKTEVADLDLLFEFQKDPEAGFMAAFVHERWQDRDAYLEKWHRLLNDPAIDSRSVLVDGELAGSVGTWPLGEELQITYGVRRDFWGRGIATRALKQFLELASARPLFGRVAFDNSASVSVLTKCGFRQIGMDRGYAHARGKEIDELVFVLDQ